MSEWIIFFSGETIPIVQSWETFHKLLDKSTIHSFSLSPSLLSNGSDLLEGYWADRHGVHWPGGGPAVSLSAQHHHCALYYFSGYCVLHHFCAHLLHTAACSAAERWSTPFPVSLTLSHFSFFYLLGTVMCIVREYIKWVCFEFIFYRTYLDVNIGLAGDQAEQYMQKAIFLCFASLDTLKRLVFVSCLFDSLKVRCIHGKYLLIKIA